jgi:hypothetical protein
MRSAQRMARDQRQIRVPEATLAPAIARLAAKARTAPLGILLIAAVLAVIGVGSVTVGVYLALSDGVPSLWAGTIALVVAPTILYLAYHLLSLARWAWVALLVVTGLLFVSSLVRIAVTPEFPVAATLEIVAELVLAFYLTRAGIRGKFG